MASSIFVYTLLLVVPIYLFIALMAFRSKEVEGYLSFGLLMITAGIYSLGYFFEIHSLSQEAVFNWLRFEYLGLAPMPALWLIFVMRYCGYSRWLSKPVLASLWTIPAITMLMINTNPFHGLFYTSFSVDFTQGLAIASIDRGPWYWVHIGFFNVALLVGSILLLYTYVKSKDIYRKRFLLLFLGSLVPWITLILYLIGMTPMNLDLSPFGILLTGIIYIFNATNYKMFDFLALARAEALRKSEEKYRLIFEHSPLGIFHFDHKGIITDCNDNFVKIIGSSRQKIVGLNLHTLPDEKFKKAFNVVLNGELANYEGVYHSVTAVKVTPVRALFAPLLSLDKQVLGGVGIVEDITERKSYEIKLEYLSLHDKLTGIYNRAFFEEELNRLQKNGAYPITVISCDLDGLKIINDTMGHSQGDKLLQSCAQVLRKALREEDILARIGGDEFAIILPHTTQLTGEEIAKEVGRNVEEYNKRAKELPLSISVGVATAVDSSKSIGEVVKEADEKMYHEKLIEKRSSRSQIISSLLAALADKDYITEGHSQRVEQYCIQIAHRLNLLSDRLTNIKLLAHVHDLGQVGISDNILKKPAPLTKEEWEIIRQHPEKGYRIAVACPDLAGVAEHVLKHHEWWDGTGYPLGLKEAEIPIECRILAVADAFDAMTSKRPYREPMGKEEALEELKRCSGTQFDPEIVAVFLSQINQ